MKITNPASNSLIKEIEEDSLEVINKKYLLVKKGQKEWANTTLAHRVSCIKRFAELLIENKDELAKELSNEMGKPIMEALGEVGGAAVKCEYFIKESEAVLKQEQVMDDGTTKEIIAYDPLGVIANISAWNYPYLVGVNIFVPALICGNSVLYKPSEFTTMVGMSIEKYLVKAGVPANVFQAVFGLGVAGAALCDLDLDGYFFTGSYKTGKIIAQAVASKLVPVGLELGGKDPLYVTEDVTDIKEAAQSAVEGAFWNNGQSCCSVERVYVHESIHDEFIEHFKVAADSLIVGDPSDEKTQMGAITREAHLSFLADLVSDAKEKGAKVLSGGYKLDQAGNFFKPTVLINMSHKMRCMKEETFGPVIGIQKVGSDEEAVKLMNDTEYGLTSSVFTSDKARGEKILSQINSGTGYLNCCDRVSGYLPWSGRGHSGLGSTLSKHGLYAFCNPKALHIRGFK
jgi:acyl-CoA reductase-like NAD-dependent aldehyde dehydrogenase